MHHQPDPAMQDCIETCLDCAQICRETAMQHCLEAGGRHVEPDHFRLMMACATICTAAADVMMIGVPQHRAVCRACVEICEACATSCETIGDMEECVAICRDCAQSCRSMAA